MADPKHQHPTAYGGPRSSMLRSPATAAKETDGDREGTTGGKLWRYFMYSLPPK
jgi:hypothetical protein